MNLIPPIRPLIKPDFVDADALLALAFNSHFSRMLDLQLYLKMQPDGWFVMQKEERLVGMVGALNYGTYAHVGFMAIHPDFQHQGLGMALMQHLLADLDDKNVPLVTLDASLAGEGLYAKMGFINLDETVTFQHPGQVTLADLPAGVEPMTVGDLDAVVQWDEPVFGAERLKVFQPFLEVFPGRIFIQRDNQGQINGFLVAQPRRIGPWVATDLQSAEHLLQAALTLPFEEETMIAVPTANPDASSLLLKYGFYFHHRNQHMLKGGNVQPGQRQYIFAQTSITIG